MGLIPTACRAEAEVLGLTLVDLGRQVRQGFYGEEAQRIQRGRDDIRVMVRYPKEDRRSLGDMESMRIRTPDGHDVRFRPILLTSLTTFFGLLPLLLERSLQARFLIPMAVSLSFGVLFATFITLVLVPAGYLIAEDVKAVTHGLWHRSSAGPSVQKSP